MPRPTEASIAITYKCNSQCMMCNIWKSDSIEELPPHEYSKLPDSLRTINVTGGEPFLRRDIVEVLRNIHGASPKSRIVISSNGMLTDRIAQVMGEIRSFHKKIGIGISIDGTNDTHNRIRGVQGGYEKAIRTIDAVKSLGIRDVRIGMTIVEENSSQISNVYELSKRLGVEFTTTVAHNSDVYFKKTDNVRNLTSRRMSEDLDMVRDEYLRTFALKNWFRAYHVAGISNPSLRHKEWNKCDAGSGFFFMDPKGDVYPCVVMNRVIGSIRSFENFDALLSSRVAVEVRDAVRACRADCWMVCNVRSLIGSHPTSSVVWILKNKPRAHMSRGR